MGSVRRRHAHGRRRRSAWPSRGREPGRAHRPTRQRAELGLGRGPHRARRRRSHHLHGRRARRASISSCSAPTTAAAGPPLVRLGLRPRRPPRPLSRPRREVTHEQPRPHPARSHARTGSRADPPVPTPRPAPGPGPSRPTPARRSRTPAPPRPDAAVASRPRPPRTADPEPAGLTAALASAAGRLQSSCRRLASLLSLRRASPLSGFSGLSCGRASWWSARWSSSWSSSPGRRAGGDLTDQGPARLRPARRARRARRR